MKGQIFDRFFDKLESSSVVLIDQEAGAMMRSRMLFFSYRIEEIKDEENNAHICQLTQLDNVGNLLMVFSFYDVSLVDIQHSEQTTAEGIAYDCFVLDMALNIDNGSGPEKSASRAIFHFIPKTQQD